MSGGFGGIEVLGLWIKGFMLGLFLGVWDFGVRGFTELGFRAWHSVLSG